MSTYVSCVICMEILTVEARDSCIRSALNEDPSVLETADSRTEHIMLRVAYGPG